MYQHSSLLVKTSPIRSDIREEESLINSTVRNQTGTLKGQKSPGSGATYKGKVLTLEEEVNNMVEDAMKHQKLELEKLRGEMQEINEIVNNNMDDFLKMNMKKLLDIEDEMKRHFAHQKAENSRLQQQINQLRGEIEATRGQLEELNVHGDKSPDEL